MKKDGIIVIVVFYISCEIMCCLCNAKKCLRMFKSVSILIFDQNSINGRYFQRPRGILDAIISVTEGLNSLGTLYIARFHKYAPLLRDPISQMISACSRSDTTNVETDIAVEDYLLQQGIIDSEIKEQILHLATTKDKARKLIDIILIRGHQAYRVFRESLLAKYPWLVEALDEELTSLLGLSSIHLTSTRAVNCSNCRQPTPTCKHGIRIDTLPHVGLRLHNGEWKVLSVKQPRSLISNEYKVEMKRELTGNVYTNIYPGAFQSLSQCPRVGDTIFRVFEVESVRQTSTDNTVKYRDIDTGRSYDREYPDHFKKYCLYYCR